MSDQAFLPLAAPFDAAQRAQLDAVLRAASPVQRAWLSGFLAGMDRPSLDQQGSTIAEPAQPAAAAVPLLLTFLTESGNSEALANRAAKAARKQGYRPKVVDFATLDLAELPKAANLIVVAATWGEGEPPARTVRPFAALMAEGAPSLAGVRFGVLGLGDTSYAEFCAIGKQIDARLEALGGTRALDRADLDLDYEEPAATWISDALAKLKPAQATTVSATVPATVAALSVDEADPTRAPTRTMDAEIVEQVNLNSSRSDKETIHLALAFDGPAPAYEPGDSLELHPENDPALVEAVLTAAGLPGNAALQAALRTERDITTLSGVTAERYAKATGHAALRQLIDSGEIRAWVEGRQFIDLLEAYPAALTAPQLTEITRKLPPRAYSIASSRKEVGDEAHLLVSAVRYNTHGRDRAGVASVYAADRVRPGARLRVRLKQNPRFRLPADPATDIVMIGPGTGVAPFRAFVQERRAIGATGRSWLFFGDRHFTHDFLYQLEWQDALHDGSLSRIDVAFSRDQPEKVYVQDRIRTNARDLIDWLDGGATFYVCGDAKHMAKDVRGALVAAYAEVKAVSPEAAEDAVATLEQAGRYQQDVY